MTNQEIDAALLGAFEAGKAILDVYGTSFSVDLKDDRSPLTEADRRGHVCIMKALDATGIPVLSEEGREIPFDERKAWKRLWVVDPLDGTKEFVKRNGEFTVNIALIEDGVPVAGIIYVPVQDIMYLGLVGKGAFRVSNYSLTCGSTGNVGSVMDLGVTLPVKNAHGRVFTVVGSRSHMSDETIDFMEQMRLKHGAVETVSMGSSLKLCLVADGTADSYPRFAPTMEWDTAAGHAIAVASGCRVTERDESTTLTYNKENLLNPWFIVYRSN